MSAHRFQCPQSYRKAAKHSVLLVHVLHCHQCDILYCVHFTLHSYQYGVLHQTLYLSHNLQSYPQVISHSNLFVNTLCTYTATNTMYCIKPCVYFPLSTDSLPSHKPLNTVCSTLSTYTATNMTYCNKHCVFSHYL